MRHRYACPLRWGDMDLLGHVNNVRYIDYLQEARGDLFRTHRRDQVAGAAEALVEGIVVVRHEVTHLRPLHYSRMPLEIEVWVTRIRSASFTLAYECFHEDASGERVVYLRASTVLAPFRFDLEAPRRLTAEERAVLQQYLDEPAAQPGRPAPVRVRPLPDRHTPMQVRFSDVDVYRHVNNVHYFEYFQEARIRLFAEVAATFADPPRLRVVVVQTDVDYHEPITLRPEPYDCWSRIAAVGTTSMTVESTITPPGEPDRVLAAARVVLVFFDPATEQAVAPAEDYRRDLIARVSED